MKEERKQGIDWLFMAVMVLSTFAVIAVSYWLAA